jgi:hypothetical protein
MNVFFTAWRLLNSRIKRTIVRDIWCVGNRNTVYCDRFPAPTTTMSVNKYQRCADLERSVRYRTHTFIEGSRSTHTGDRSNIWIPPFNENPLIAPSPHIWLTYLESTLFYYFWYKINGHLFGLLFNKWSVYFHKKTGPPNISNIWQPSEKIKRRKTKLTIYENLLENLMALQW